MTIWIFGDSLSLPYNLDNPADGWPEVLSQRLNINCKNYAQPAVDNFYIYQCYLNHAKQIQFNDIVIISDVVWASFIDKNLKSVAMEISKLFAYEEVDNSTVMFLNDIEKRLLNDFSFSEENRFKVGEIGTYFPW